MTQRRPHRGRFAERRGPSRRRRDRGAAGPARRVRGRGGLVWVVWFSSALAVNRIEIEGTTTLKSTDIRSQAAVRLGEPLARVDTVAIESRVAAMERIDQVEVTRHWPRTIRIEVVERKPIAWVLSGGDIRALDRYGVDFRSLRPSRRTSSRSGRDRDRAQASAGAGERHGGPRAAADGRPRPAEEGAVRAGGLQGLGRSWCSARTAPSRGGARPRASRS